MTNIRTSRALTVTIATAGALLLWAVNGPMAGHNPQMPWHYDLHAWVIENNPAGMFSQWNPSISC